MSKHAMHAFFIRRMGHTFQNTALAIAPWKINSFCFISWTLIALMLTLVVLLCMDIEAELTIFGGTYCALETDRSMYFALFMAVAMVTDVTLCFVVNFVMVKKLLMLVSAQFKMKVTDAMRQSIVS